MNSKTFFYLFIALLWVTENCIGQRVYKANSVLATGSWYKIALKDPGIYKIDVSFLNNLGINTSSLSSASIRIFGNGGGMLEEENAIIPQDDLSEISIMINDGNDGIFNGSDYFLFYGEGPDKWLKDSVNKKFIHQKNIYTDSAYYFISIFGAGKRVNILPQTLSPNLTVNYYSERYFHELDSVNLLSSGKDWFGEEFMNAPGKTLSRTFSVLLPGLQTSSPVTIISDCIARSVNIGSRFDLQINNQLVQQINIPSTGGSIYDFFAHQTQQISNATLPQETFQVNYTYVPGGFNAQAWLNWFEIHARSSLSLSSSGRLLFRDWNSVGNNIGEFIISNANNTTQVWDITNPPSPLQMTGNFSANEFRFVHDCSRLREYVAFNPANTLVPVSAGRIANQNLHNSQTADFLIVTHPALLIQAERLANFHRKKDNLKVVVVTTEQIFNEFSSGSLDPVAIKDFVKMYYDKASGNPVYKPKYLLLFGRASFDYKNRIINNTNLVPAYENKISIDPLSTYTSDDFFGFLDDNENINSGLVTNLLDIGIGRIPAKNPEEAKNYVDKVEAYFSKESFGSWRTNISFVADDEDNNLHLQDAEIITSTAATANPLFNIQKIYLDAFKQESGSGGSRYPLVNETINNRIFNGTLLFNFNGHGGSSRLAEEVIMDQEMINGWKNDYRLPLFITATCDFAPYDNPFTNSLGENILLRPRTGGIGLMTTTRLVFSFSNRIINNNYLQIALKPDASGNYKSLGESLMAAKNYTYQNSGDITNNRKFTLLGDPALTLAFPKVKIKTNKINAAIVPLQSDTLSAGKKTVIEGEITDFNGALLPGFNGTIFTTVFDKPQTINTLGNDPSSPVTTFQQQSTVLFKGKAVVSNGKFSVEFKVPKDINYQYGNGKISYYSENGIVDGGDNFNGFVVGGSSSVIDNDKEGPVINAWLNDEKFVNGGISNQSPVLLLKLSDSSGINTSGIGIGHDISITIDNDINRFSVLNEFYEAELGNYRLGTVRFQLPFFEPGPHSIKIKVWDVLNNSSEYLLEFTVANDEELVISHVLNYPNPFTTKTQFWFEHNKPREDLSVRIQIYTMTGRVIKSIEKTINTAGNRSSELEWDGRDEFGDKLGRGVYLYKIQIQNNGSKPRTIIEKLVIL